MTKQIYFSKYPRLVFSFTIFLLLAACGGGGGSSGGGIAAQGLWIQSDSTCRCRQNDIATNPATRCFFYFEGGKAVSGHLSQASSRCGSGTYRPLSSTESTDIRNEARRVTLDGLSTQLNGIRHIFAAGGTVFDVGEGRASGVRNINFVYGGEAARRGRLRVCSVYRRESDTVISLGRGTPGDSSQVSTEVACNNNRYRTLDRYIQP